MNASTSANAYKTQQIMTASKEELTLMLYNGAIRFANECIQALENGDLVKAHNANMRVQDIVREFMVTLDMQYEISHNFFALYEFMQYYLTQGNLKKDKAMIIEVRDMLAELRDTWFQAMKQNKVAQAAGR